MNAPTETTSAQTAAPSRSSRYARGCMICGAALIGWSIAAPAGTLLWNALRTGGDEGTPQNTGTVAVAATATKREHNPVAPTDATLLRRHPTENPLPSVPAGRSRVPKATSTGKHSLSPAEQKERREILDLYNAWKAAWQTRNVDAIMSLYSPQIRFSSAGEPKTGYKGLRTWFERLWAEGPYTVSDLAQPHLTISGNRAVLIVGQDYLRHGRVRFTNRFFFIKEASQDSASLTSKSTRRWRIVEEDYLPFQGSTDLQTQIY